MKIRPNPANSCTPGKKIGPGFSVKVIGSGLLRLGYRADLHLWLLGALLVLGLFLCVALLERQPTGWDALGYQVAGENIARGNGPAMEHPFNGELGPYFALAAFADQDPRNPTRVYLNYPPGFPLLLALPQWLGLPDFLMLPVLSVLSVLFVYSLGGLLFDRWTGLLGAAIVAFTPVFLEWSTAFWADMPGMCFVLGAFAAYIAACRQKKRTRRFILGSAAGAMVILTVFIRYSNALVLFPILAYAIYTQRRTMFGSGVNWVFGAIVFAGMIGVGIYNQVVYGGPFETHYSAARSGYNFPLFSISYALGPSPIDGYGILAVGKVLWHNFSWMLAFALLGLVRASREAVVSLLGSFLVFFVLSSTFAWAPLNEDTRYLLPLLAPVGLFAARGCLSVLDLRASWRGWLLGAVLIAIGVTSCLSLVESWHLLGERNRTALKTQQAAQSLTAGSERDAVFLAYYWNDPINSFGERTTLFYRRMNLRDAVAFEAELTRVVADLLQDDLEVYYVVDYQPPPADSLQILQRHFELCLWKKAPKQVYHIFLSE